MRQRRTPTAIMLAVMLLLLPARGFAQTATVGDLAPQQSASTGTLRGKVTLADGGTPLANVIVNIVQLKRSANTDETGAYELTNIPPGTYTVLVHMEGFPDQTQQVTVGAG